VSCEKVQVTFAVRAAQGDLPLGQPIALVFMTSTADLRKLTFVIPCGDADFVRQVWHWPPARLQSKIAEEIGAVVSNGVWERLLMTEGIQDELPQGWLTD
jgi:hypothetical protein